MRGAAGSSQSWRERDARSSPGWPAAPTNELNLCKSSFKKETLFQGATSYTPLGTHLNVDSGGKCKRELQRSNWVVRNVVSVIALSQNKRSPSLTGLVTAHTCPSLTKGLFSSKKHVSEKFSTLPFLPTFALPQIMVHTLRLDLKQWSPLQLNTNPERYGDTA